MSCIFTKIKRLSEQEVKASIIYTEKDIADYYDQTQNHFRRFWKLEEAMGLHYGIWEEGTKDLASSILNTNRRLTGLGKIKGDDVVLDAGCGVGGSSIFLARYLGCRVTGITLSNKQLETCHQNARKHGVSDRTTFLRMSYLSTSFSDQSFDVVWALESFSSCSDDLGFFQEMYRLVKPGGSILMADFFKPQPLDINRSKGLKTMMNGWAIQDILTVKELEEIVRRAGFSVDVLENVSDQVKPTVDRMYRAGQWGRIGTYLYNLFFRATPYSRTHYKTGLAQKIAFENGEWRYYLIKITKT